MPSSLISIQTVVLQVDGQALGREIANALLPTFVQIVGKLDKLIAKDTIMAQELEDLKTEVAEEKDVMASATLLINGFSARLQAAIDAAVAAGGSADEFIALKNELDASGAELAAAVAANTPT